MDPVSDMLVIIKNGYMANKNFVLVPHSRFKWEIAKVFESSKYVGKVTKDILSINIELLYPEGRPKITQIRRVSKLGLRVYRKYKNIKKIKGGKGIIIISTPKGVMTGEDARKKKFGGEVICEVW